MKYPTSILLSCISLLAFSQTDTIIGWQNIEMAEEFEPRCDSVIQITTSGNIDYKLVFEQNDINPETKNQIIIPRTTIDKNDRSVLFSEFGKSNATILVLGYDTCKTRSYNQPDTERDLEIFGSSGDSNGIIDWKVSVEFQNSGCLDSPFNTARISKSESDFIKFSCARNVEVFELDLNHDSANEIYLISYVWCQSKIQIYRIDVK